MTEKDKTQNTILKRGKYEKAHWKAFLNEAFDRIAAQEDFVKRRGEFADVDLNSITEPLSPYEVYEKELIKFMRDYESTYHGILELAHSEYADGKSQKFFSESFELMDESKMRHYFKQCKILIVTANPIEKATLHHCICRHNGRKKIKRFICDTNVYYVFKWGSYLVAHVHQHNTGANKDLGMTTTIHEALKHIKPNVIFSLGVAYGMDYKSQNLGDVLVSKHIFPYAENKRDGEKIIPDRGQDKIIDNWLDVRFANASGFLDGVTYGGMLSGGSVMSSAQEKDRVCTAYFENDFIIGGEMEGSGLFQTTYFTDIPCAVIKGICDWGVAKNGIFGAETIEDGTPKEEWFKDSLQAYAMIKVVEKCEPLFRDKTLFSSSKNETAEHEKKKNKFLTAINIFLIISMITTSLMFGFKDSFNYINVTEIELIAALLMDSFIGLVLTLLVVFKKHKTTFEKRIEDIIINEDFK